MDSPYLLYCPSCGAANPDHATQCFACEKPISSVSSDDTITTIVSPSQTEQHVSDHLLKQRYRLIQRIGEGGFGAVYKAEDTHLGHRIVAIKEMSQHGLSPQEVTEATAAFKREALLLAGLTHPNLPRIYEHFTEAGQWYLVMDFIEGETLETRLQNSSYGRLSIKEAMQITTQLCTVLDYLHTRQPPVIFRDLKPANIILTPEGQLYLIDFGIARHFKPGQLKDTIAFGSPGYAAPEQYGKKQTTPRADVYSLGVILHQMLTGQDPAEEPFSFASPRIYNAFVYHELAMLVMQMVEMDVDKRPTSVAVVKQRLQEIVRGETEPDITAAHALYARPSASLSTQIVLSTPGSSASPGSAKQVMYPPSSSSPTSQGKGWRATIGLFLAIATLVIGTCVFSVPRSSPDYHSSSDTDAPAEVSTPDLTATVNALSLGGVLPITDAGEQTGPIGWSPDGQYIAYVTPNGQSDVEIRNIATGNKTPLFTGDSNHAFAIVWTDSTHIMGVSDDQKVYVWSVPSQGNSTQGNATSLSHHNSSWTLTAVAWSPNDQYIASAEENSTISVWSALTGATVATYSGHSQLVRALAWSPDGKFIASAGDDQTVQIWNATTGKVIFTYHGHTAQVNALAWSPDGKRIASASDDKTVQVWDANNGGHIFTYRSQSNMLTLAWSHDGQEIASGGDDQRVQLWNAATGAIVYNKGYSASVETLTWSPHDDLMASTGNDNSFQIWKAK
jgi:eukaryotic-like serine/threonine-protein kinase